MRERDPMTQTMKASQARQEWSQVLNQVFRGEKRVLVEKSGIPVAAIVSAEDLERLKQFEAQRAQRFQALEALAARNADQDPEEAEQDIAEEIAAMRREQQEQAASPSSR